MMIRAMLCGLMMFLPVLSSEEPSCTPISSQNATMLSRFFETEVPQTTAIHFPYGSVWSPESTSVSFRGTAVDVTGTASEDSESRFVTGAYLPDGTPLMMREQDSGLDVLNGESLNHLDLQTEFITGLAFSLDADRGAAGDSFSKIQLWDVTTGERLMTFEGHEEGIPVNALAFNPSGTLLASGAYDNQVFLWDTVTGKALYNFKQIDDHVEDVEFSPDERLLAVVTRHAIAFITLEDFSANVIDFPAAGSVLDAAFSPDAALLAVIGVTDAGAGSAYMQVWDTSTFTRLLVTDLAYPLNGIRFSPNGCFIALTGYDENGIIQLWRVGDGSLPG